MRSRYRFEDGRGLYLVTSSIIEFIPVFISQQYCQIITNSFEYCRNNKEVEIIAYVVMPNHFHALIYSEDLSGKVRSIKRYTAKQIIKQAESDKKEWLLNQFQYYKKDYKTNSSHQVWQEGAHPQLMQNLDMVEQKINYIHHNPVRNGLVQEPDDWVYSSASNYSDNKGIIEIDKIEEF